MTAASSTLSWTDQGTSFRTDALCFILALAFHAPLLWVRMDVRKATADTGPKERLVAVDLIDSVEKKAPPPVAVKKETSFMDKLKALVKNEPPPPPVPKKALEPKKLADAPSQIKLQPKLADAPKIDNKLVSKSKFETKNPDLVQERKISLKNLDAGVAPLSAKKVGVITDRGKVISDKGDFKVSNSEVLKGIGGSGPGLAGAPAPTVAIRTGKSASVEKFSAAQTAKTGKSGFQGGSVDGLDPKNLSLRDRIIARDAAPSQIAKAGSGGSAAGAIAGMAGGLATKQDAGRFEGGAAGGSGSFSGGTAGSVSKSPAKIASAPAAPVRKQKKDLFTITGPLKDRPIVKRVIPRYPSWAQSQGIEAAVVLEFTVQPNGRVKNNIVVRRTTGYPKLDESAIDALKQWVFEALDDINREEVGLITFTYTLE